MERLKKQRVFDTIAHKVSDRFPIQIDFSPLALEKYLKYLKLEVKSEVQLLEMFDNHIVYAYLNDVFGKTRTREIPDSPYIFDEWGVGWDCSQEGTCFYEYPLADIKNYYSYSFPDPYSDEIMQGVSETVNEFASEYIVSSYQKLCLFERCWSLRGFENFLVDLIEENDFANELLDRVTEHQIIIAKRWIDMGINCARTGDDYGGQSGMLMSPELWRRMIKPRLQKIWDVYKGAGLPLIHHTCGDVRPIIPDFIEMGLDVLNNVQSETMPIEELSDKYGDKLVFYGGISCQHILARGTPQQVREEVKRVIQVLGRHRALIISPSVALTSDVPLENIIALIEGIREYNVIE